MMLLQRNRGMEMIWSIVCFGLIFGTHALLGDKIESNDWSLWKTLALTFVVILFGVILGIILQTLMLTILLTVIMATILQRKFLHQPKKA